MNLLQIAEKYQDGKNIMLDWLGDGGAVVPTADAQARADICTGRTSGAPCCHNFPESAVESFIGEALKKIIEIKNEAGLRVQGNKSLGVCSVCKCHLATKVFTPMKHIRKFTSDEEFKKLPGFCWQRTESGI